MIDRLLKIHLEPIAREQQRARSLRRLSRAWLALAAVALIFVWIRIFTGWRSPWTFLVLAAIAVGWTILILLNRQTSDADYQKLARQIEAQNPELHAVLLTAVEQKPDAATGELNYLQERLIREALAHDRNRAWRADAARQLRFARLCGAGAFAVLVAALIPVYQAAPPKQALLAVTGKSVSVTPGDASVEKGSSLVVLAKFEGEVPATATLIVRPANQPEQRIPLVKNLADPVFGTSLPDVTGELTYRVEYGGEQTRDFKITTFEYPRLERADAKLTYPEYTGLGEKAIENTKRVSAVEGSALDYTFHLNKPVKSATLVPIRRRANDANKEKSAVTAPLPEVSAYELPADASRPNVRTLNTKLYQNARYELILVDESGRTNKMPPQFVFEALTNRTPDLKFAFPRGDQRVSALEEIAFKAEASDDFGLKAYGIAYNLAGQETKFVALGTNATAHEKRSFDQLVPLEDMHAQADQLLSYYVWADDVGPDGNVRRTSSDMFFAEVRPFEEIFREGESQGGNSAQQQQQQQQEGQGQGAAEKLAELQKQIINATWNLQRRENSKTPSVNYKADASVVKESQEKALEQLAMQKERTDDPRSTTMLEAVEKEMKKAVEELSSAAEKNTLTPLPPALSAEQSAYQALLRLAAREYQVSRSNQRSNQRSQTNSRNQRAQRQVDQLDLKQSQNRYETERQAAPQQQQDPKQREQLQAFNRLKELAQRQQDVNERLKELQSALAEAKTEAEREDLQRRLKRLQEEQQQMLADVDELRQRMERPENQSDMSQARQQLEQTREEVQQAAESMQRGEVSQALSSGTRAQRDLQQMRDDFRKQNSSQFAEDMRSMRNEARELAQKQEEIGQKLDSLDAPQGRKALTDSDERQELASQLDQQKKRMDDLVKHATDVTEKAEAVEPLLSKQLYDTIRKAAQDDTKNLQETGEDLAEQGRLRVGVEQQLRKAKEDNKKAVEVAANFLRDGLSAEADNLEQRARKSINDFRGGVERAAQSVLGDDTEALRQAQRTLDELSAQLEREIAQATGGGTNSARGPRGTAQARAGSTNDAISELTPNDSATNSITSANRLATGQTNNIPGRQPGQGEISATGSTNSPTGRDGQQVDAQSGRQGREREGENQQAANGQGRREGQPQEDNQPRRGQSQRNGQAQAGNQPGQGQPGEQQPGESRGQASSGGQGRNGRTDQPGEATAIVQGDGQPNEGQQRTGSNRGGQRNFFDQAGNGSAFDGGWTGPLTGPDYANWSDRLRDVEEMIDIPELRTEVARIRDRAREFRVDIRRNARPLQWEVVNLQLAAPLADLRSRITEELSRRESKEALVPIDRDPVPTRYSELVRRYYEQLGKSESDGSAPPKNVKQ